MIEAIKDPPSQVSREHWELISRLHPELSTPELIAMCVAEYVALIERRQMVRDLHEIADRVSADAITIEYDAEAAESRGT